LRFLGNKKSQPPSISISNQNKTYVRCTELSGIDTRNCDLSTTSQSALDSRIAHQIHQHPEELLSNIPLCDASDCRLNCRPINIRCVSRHRTDRLKVSSPLSPDRREIDCLKCLVLPLQTGPSFDQAVSSDFRSCLLAHSQSYRDTTTVALL